VSLAGKVKVKVKSGTAVWQVAIILTDGSSTVQVQRCGRWPLSSQTGPLLSRYSGVAGGHYPHTVQVQ
jgi:hypothetical protein